MRGTGNQHLCLDEVVVEERMTAPGSDLSLGEAEIFFSESRSSDLSPTSKSKVKTLNGLT